VKCEVKEKGREKSLPNEGEGVEAREVPVENNVADT